MKRNKQSTRAMRQRTTAEIKAKGSSRYALKVKSGKQMYAGTHYEDEAEVKL